MDFNSDKSMRTNPDDSEKVRRLKTDIVQLTEKNTELRAKLDSLNKKYRNAIQEIETLQKIPQKGVGGWLQFSLEKGQNPFLLELPLPNADKRMQFVYVPAGTLKMGLSREEVDALIWETQNPIYEIEEVPNDLRTRQFQKSFLIGKYEVTHEEYQTLILDHQYASTEAHKPVTHLTEEEIRKFCQLLNDAYPQLDIGLPTEKEWEYAAKESGEHPYTWGEKFAHLP